MSEGGPSDYDQKFPVAQQESHSHTSPPSQMGQQQADARSSPQNEAGERQPVFSSPGYQEPRRTTPNPFQTVQRQPPVPYQTQYTGQLPPSFPGQNPQPYQTRDQQPPHSGLAQEQEQRRRNQQYPQTPPRGIATRGSPTQQIPRTMQGLIVSPSPSIRGVQPSQGPQNTGRSTQRSFGISNAPDMQDPQRPSTGPSRSPFRPPSRNPEIRIRDFRSDAFAAGTGQSTFIPNNTGYFVGPGVGGFTPGGPIPTSFERPHPPPPLQPTQPVQDESEDDDDEDDEVRGPSTTIPIKGDGWKLAYTSAKCRPKGRVNVDHWFVETRPRTGMMSANDRLQLQQPANWQTPGYAESIGEGLNSGMNWLGFFHPVKKTLPVTKCAIQIHRGRGAGSRGAPKPYVGYPKHSEVIPSGLSLHEICQRFPNHCWGDGLRIFKSENWGGHEIFNAFPEDVKKQCAPNATRTSDRPHNFLQAAMGREVDMMAAEDNIFRKVRLNDKKGRPKRAVPKDEGNSDEDDEQPHKRMRQSSGISVTQQGASTPTPRQPVTTGSVSQSVRDAATAALVPGSTPASSTQPGHANSPQGAPFGYFQDDNGRWWAPVSPSTWMPRMPFGQTVVPFIDQPGVGQTPQTQSGSTFASGPNSTRGSSHAFQTGSTQSGGSNALGYGSNTTHDGTVPNNTSLNAGDARDGVDPSRPSVNKSGCDTTASGTSGDDNNGNAGNATNPAAQTSNAGTLPPVPGFNDIPVARGPRSPESVTRANNSDEDDDIDMDQPQP